MNPVAGTAVVARPEFTDGPALVAAVVRHLKAKGILASDSPIAADKGWARFRAGPRTDWVTLTLIHWGGRLFPVANGGRDIDKAPLATFVVVLDNSLEDADEQLLAALSEALGTSELEQTYMDP
jgi:hypothetical protein